ncbi:hypothetical protein GWK08_12860 [Leptobacterium flavescens]|uniref:Uncharacterized protein n=1 Tax=Leptobacterium flavescens TaxID=472055 RepID=A0A6P0UVB2_9FLAO|nr:hypothetical protein [Leptobacterium flavescens]NER14336.1 hypothetical protein [Leptobacterium flavescens]
MRKRLLTILFLANFLFSVVAPVVVILISDNPVELSFYRDLNGEEEGKDDLKVDTDIKEVFLAEALQLSSYSSPNYKEHLSEQSLRYLNIFQDIFLPPPESGNHNLI